MPPSENVINAEPSKEFFIDMLTKDISLTECIFDLIDNSLQSLIGNTDLDVMTLLLSPNGTTKKPVKDRCIDVHISKNKFEITDNCGGISISEAREDVFRFGTPHVDRSHAGLGVYGIGMKRAVFKLGRLIEVVSCQGNEEFVVKIDVDRWKKDPSWELQFEYAGRHRLSGSIAQASTRIVVTDLHSTVQRMFSLSSFESEVLRRLSTTYALFLGAGVKIRLNGRAVDPELPLFAESEKLTSARKLYKDNGVDVLIVVGVTSREDKTPRGWYIFCNGRLVLEADQSERTGWGGDGLPQFHVKYNHFLGIVSFRSKDVRLLPWITTKDDVELESSIYQRALGQMRLLGKSVTNFLNRLYPSDPQPEGEPELEVLESAKEIPLRQVARQKKNSSFSARSTPAKEEQNVTISFRRPSKIVQEVKRSLGRPTMATREVGEKVFDYYVNKEIPR